MAANTSEVGSLAALSRFGPGAEALWTGIAPVQRPGALRKIVFVGAGQGVGTTTTALCTAVGLARHLRATVTLVEVGLGSSSLAPLLGLPEGPGLCEMLTANAPLSSCTRGCGLEGLAIVTAGRGLVPPGVFASERSAGIFAELGADRDFLLLDAPPLAEHPELRSILLHAQEAVLVLEADRTTREQARSLVEVLSRSGITLLGSVLNRTRAGLFS